MRAFILRCILIGAAPSMACGDPLVSIALQGRRAGSGDPYGSFVVPLQAGETIDYRVLFDIAPLGTQNVQGATTRTIDSLTPGTDGVNRIRFDLVQSASLTGMQADFNAAATLSLEWDDVTGASGGTLLLRNGTNHDLTSILAGHSVGVFSAIDPEVVASGTFTVTSLGDGSAAILTPRFTTFSASAAMRINSTSAIFPTGSTESSGDPIIGYSPLVLGIPEPGSMGLISLCVLLGADVRRRKRTARGTTRTP